MKSIGVYLGANAGNSAVFAEAVIFLGKEIARLGYTLVFGGSSLGLMGLLANTVIDQEGAVIGVTTHHLIEKEKPLTNLDELHLVGSMYERKLLMQQKSDMFLVMPGGLGTLEEAFDTWNAIKIGLVKKPIGFLNVSGYFDNLFAFFNACYQNGFISSNQLKIPYLNDNLKLLMRDMHLASIQQDGLEKLID